MEDLKIAGYGKSNGGNFNKISITGYGEIFDNVFCKTLNGSVSAKFNGTLATSDLKFSGDISVSGYCQAKNVDISGKIKI